MADEFLRRVVATLQAAPGSRELQQAATFSPVLGLLGGVGISASTALLGVRAWVVALAPLLLLLGVYGVYKGRDGASLDAVAGLYGLAAAATVWGIDAAFGGGVSSLKLALVAGGINAWATKRFFSYTPSRSVQAAQTAQTVRR